MRASSSADAISYSWVPTISQHGGGQGAAELGGGVERSSPSRRRRRSRPGRRRRRRSGPAGVRWGRPAPASGGSPSLSMRTPCSPRVVTQLPTRSRTSPRVQPARSWSSAASYSLVNSQCAPSTRPRTASPVEGGELLGGVGGEGDAEPPGTRRCAGASPSGSLGETRTRSQGAGAGDDVARGRSGGPRPWRPRRRWRSGSGPGRWCSRSARSCGLGDAHRSRCRRRSP